MEKVNEYIDFEQPSLYIATASILFVRLSQPAVPLRSCPTSSTRRLLTKLTSSNRTLSSGTRQHVSVRLTLAVSLRCCGWLTQHRPRAEYNYHILTKLAFGNRYLGCYLLAATIFSLGIFRDHL